MTFWGWSRSWPPSGPASLTQLQVTHFHWRPAQPVQTGEAEVIREMDQNYSHVLSDLLIWARDLLLSIICNDRLYKWYGECSVYMLVITVQTCLYSCFIIFLIKCFLWPELCELNYRILLTQFSFSQLSVSFRSLDIVWQTRNTLATFAFYQLQQVIGRSLPRHLLRSLHMAK